MQRLSLLILGVIIAWLGARLVGGAESFAPYLLRDALLLSVLGALIYALNAQGWQAPPVFRRLRGLPRPGQMLLLTGLIVALAGGAGLAAGLEGIPGLAAVIAWTVYSLLLRHWQSPLDPFARLTAIVAGGTVVLIPFTLAEGLARGWPAFDGRTWLLAAVVAVLPGFGAYQAYSFMQRELGPARTGIVLYLGPIWSALVAWALLGERPQAFHLAGALLILPGVYLATRSSPR